MVKEMILSASSSIEVNFCLYYTLVRFIASSAFFVYAYLVFCCCFSVIFFLGFI